MSKECLACMYGMGRCYRAMMFTYWHISYHSHMLFIPGSIACRWITDWFTDIMSIRSGVRFKIKAVFGYKYPTYKYKVVVIPINPIDKSVCIFWSIFQLKKQNVSTPQWYPPPGLWQFECMAFQQMSFTSALSPRNPVNQIANDIMIRV